MEIKKIILFALSGIILLAFTGIIFISVFDSKENIRFVDHNKPVQAINIRNDDTISKKKVLFLLTLGIAGFLGVSRKNKDNGELFRKNLKE